MTKIRKSWTYKGVNVYPARPNATGIRWSSVPVDGIGTLQADTKAGMRELITHYGTKHYGTKHYGTKGHR